MIKAFLAQDDYNVIVVDWGNVAMLPYLISAAKIKVVARYIAQMIDFLVSQGTDPEDMTLVGHSLGAHVMGLAGYQTTTKVGHIVGKLKNILAYAIFATAYKKSSIIYT